jgi:hypothetical protein
VIRVIEIVSGPQLIEPQPVGPRRHEPVFGFLVMAQLVGPEMPLADIRCIVTAFAQNVSETLVLRAKAQFVDHHAGARLVFAREQRRAIGSADRGGRHGVPDVEGLASQAVDIGRVRKFIAGIAAGKAAQLVCEDIDQVDRPRSILRQRRTGLAQEGAATDVRTSIRHVHPLTDPVKPWQSRNFSLSANGVCDRLMHEPSAIHIERLAGHSVAQFAGQK